MFNNLYLKAAQARMAFDNPMALVSASSAAMPTAQARRCARLVS